VCSAAGEFGGSEDSAAVLSVGVLADDGALDVMLAGAQLFHHFSVEVRLSASVGGGHELLAVVLVTVLLGGPAEVLTLGGGLEDFSRESINFGVGDGGFLDFLLGVLGD